MGRREKLREKFTKRASPKDIPRIEKKLDLMNRGPIKKVWDKVQLLWKFIKDPEAAWETKAAAIGALIYLIFPVDAVPDVIPVFGLLDDVAVILFVYKMLADALKKYVVDIVEDTTIKITTIKVIGQIIIVLASLLGAIAIVSIDPVPKLNMNFAELDLLTVYQLILLGAAIPTLVATIYRVQKWIARYQQLPRIWQIPIKQGLYSIIRRFMREEWLMLLLLLILAGLTIAIRTI